MRKLSIVFFALAITACSRFNTEEANFVAYNVSNDPIEFYVNDGAGRRIAPNGTDKFTVSIQVATRAVGDTSPSYTVDKMVQVSVAVKNLRTGRLTSPRMCQAGAKVITHLSYEMYQGGYEDVRCQSTYPYQAEPVERWAEIEKRRGAK